jgi:hypothetical protein
MLCLPWEIDTNFRVSTGCDYVTAIACRLPCLQYSLSLRRGPDRAGLMQKGKRQEFGVRDRFWEHRFIGQMGHGMRLMNELRTLLFFSRLCQQFVTQSHVSLSYRLLDFFFFSSVWASGSAIGYGHMEFGHLAPSGLYGAWELKKDIRRIHISFHCTSSLHWVRGSWRILRMSLGEQQASRHLRTETHIQKETGFGFCWGFHIS